MTVITPRVLQVRVGPPGAAGLLWQDVAMEISVDKVGGRSPSKGEARLYNLGPASLAHLATPGHTMQILAGEPTPTPLFLGDVTKGGVDTKQAGTNWITTIKAADGRRAFRDAKFSQSYPANHTRDQIFADLLVATGLTRGYVSPTLTGRAYAAEQVFHGSARSVLSRIWAPDGARWSIQDGAIQVLAANDAAPGQGTVISASSGMHGSPKVTKKGMEVKTILTPGLRPGSVVQVVSRKIKGFWRATAVKHRAKHLVGTDWHTTIGGVQYV